MEQHWGNKSKLQLFTSVLNVPLVSPNGCAALEVCKIVSSLVNTFQRFTTNIL